MKNLKRIFSLALAGTMLAGMLTIGASAAKFSDDDTITNDTAVNFMVALNVITGNDDGSFAPERTVTRGEMAAMITRALNGGRTPVLGSGVTNFSDVGNHWAANYIQYCANLHIIDGRGDGTFGPNDTVTGSEAAKMMLVAMGYQSDWFGFTGLDWEINVNTQANSATIPGGAGNNNAGIRSLYDGLANSFNPSEGLTRDNAAQLLYNGVRGETMAQTSVSTGTEGTRYNYGKTGDSILTSKFDYEVEYGFLTGVEYDEDEETFSYTIGTTFANANLSTNENNNAFNGGADVIYGEDVSNLFGQKVQVVYDAETLEAVGIYASGSKVVGTINVGQLSSTLAADATSMRISGTTYRFDGAHVPSATDNDQAQKVAVYEMLDTASTQTLNTIRANTNLAYGLDLVDNDGDGRVNYAVVHPFTVAEVTFINSTSITAGSSYKFEDNHIYDGVKRGDWVKITTKEYTGDNKAVVEKIEPITGEIRALRTDASQVQIGSTWYTHNYNGTFGTIYTVGDEYDMVIVNDYIFNAEKTSESFAIENAVYVNKIDGVGTGLNAGTQKVELMFTDGTKRIVTVDKTDTKTPGTMADIAADNDIKDGQVFTYRTDKDGNYELTTIKNADFDAVKGSTSTAININETKATGGSDDKNGRGTFFFNDDAVVFVKANDDKAKVLTGADVNKWKATNGYDTKTDGKSFLYANESNGFNSVVLAVLDLNEAKVPGASGTTKYGYLTAKSSFVKENGDNYIEMTLWDGTDEITVLAETIGSGATGVNRGDENGFARDSIISYEDLGGNKIGSVVNLNVANAGADAVVGYAGGKAITFVGEDGYEIGDDTVILYVDTANHAGAEGGTITLAQKDAAGAYVRNVYVYGDGATPDEKVALLVVDTTNSLAINKDVTLATAAVAGVTLHTTGANAGKATVAANTTISAVEAAALGTANLGGVKVVKGTNNTNQTLVQAGDVIHITGTNGTDHAFTVL